MPALDCRIIPARSISRCETIWASLGFSRNKGRKYSERRIEPHPRVGRRTLGKTREPVHRACRRGFDCCRRRARVRAHRQSSRSRSDARPCGPQEGKKKVVLIAEPAAAAAPNERKTAG